MSEVDIIFENDDVVVVNKPAGLMVHADGRKKVDTLATWLVKRYPSLEGVGEEDSLVRAGIVHRLDTDTSGVMIVAKTQDAFLYLQEQFLARSITKKYNALVYGIVKEDSKLIDAPIARSKSDFRKWAVSLRGRGREAVTGLAVLERFSLRPKLAEDFTYLELTPRTGRTHQLRVHLSHIGHPVLCDKLYAPTRQCVPTMPRQALHARSLEIMLPTGERRAFEAPLPADMQTTLDTLRALC